MAGTGAWEGGEADGIWGREGMGSLVGKPAQGGGVEPGSGTYVRSNPGPLGPDPSYSEVAADNPIEATAMEKRNRFPLPPWHPS